jgi:hypothetical protein
MKTIKFGVKTIHFRSTESTRVCKGTNRVGFHLLLKVTPVTVEFERKAGLLLGCRRLRLPSKPIDSVCARPFS